MAAGRTRLTAGEGAGGRLGCQCRVRLSGPAANVVLLFFLSSNRCQEADGTHAWQRPCLCCLLGSCCAGETERGGCLPHSETLHLTVLAVPQALKRQPCSQAWPVQPAPLPLPTCRARSGSEVRDFLRGLGSALDSGAAVVRQARVTALADSASPAELAALVAQASGLGGWESRSGLVCSQQVAVTGAGRPDGGMAGWWVGWMADWWDERCGAACLQLHCSARLQQQLAAILTCPPLSLSLCPRAACGPACRLLDPGGGCCIPGAEAHPQGGGGCAGQPGSPGGCLQQQLPSSGTAALGTTSGSEAQASLLSSPSWPQCMAGL
jgi:hypothetical protein